MKLFEQIKNYPILSKEEQFKLAREYKTGNKQAGDKLVNHNLRIALKVAHKYHRAFKQFSVEDLFGVGTIGLLEALKSYDPEKQLVFGSYAFIYVKGKTYHFIEKNIFNGFSVKHYNTMRKLKTKSKELFLILEEKDQDKKDLLIKSLAEKTCDTVEVIRECIDQANISFNSIDGKIAFDKEATLHDILPKTEVVDAVEIVYRKELVEDFEQRIRVLKPRELDIIIKVFNRGSIKQNNGFADVAREVGLSRERVRQIYNKSLEKLGVESFV